MRNSVQRRQNTPLRDILGPRASESFIRWCMRTIIPAVSLSIVCQGVLRNHPQLATQGRLTLLQSLRGATLAPWGHATVEDMQIALDDGNNTVGRMIRPS
jgi:hypothetical protein